MVMTNKKVAIALGVLAVAGGAMWLATRDNEDPARAASAATTGKAAAPTASHDSPPTHARRIDPATRTALLDAIHRAQRPDASARGGARGTGGPGASSPGARPQLADEPEVDKDYIRGQVREIIPLLTECYEKELARDPKLAGKVVVNFTIEGAPDVGGLVTESAIDADASTLESPAVRDCIQDTMYALEIAAPKGGGVVKVVYPFEFSSADGH
jgi:hypothetical protein